MEKIQPLLVSFIKIFSYKMNKRVKLEFRPEQPYTKWGIGMLSA